MTPKPARANSLLVTRSASDGSPFVRSTGTEGHCIANPYDTIRWSSRSALLRLRRDQFHYQQEHHRQIINRSTINHHPASSLSIRNQWVSNRSTPHRCAVEIRPRMEPQHLMAMLAPMETWCDMCLKMVTHCHFSRNTTGGDARRAEELFAINRNVLKNPEILPLGTALQIPGAVTMQPFVAPATSSPPASSSGSFHQTPIPQPSTATGGPTLFNSGSSQPNTQPNGESQSSRDRFRQFDNRRHLNPLLTTDRSAS